eukprot:2707827-Alexandrium_andersonii.AAC.1
MHLAHRVLSGTGSHETGVALLSSDYWCSMPLGASVVSACARGIVRVLSACAACQGTRVSRSCFRAEASGLSTGS